METKANYVLIGAFTIIIAAARLLLFGLWAAKYSSERTWQEYQVVFREAVTGLTVGSPVQYNGIAVGSITKLSLAPQRPAPGDRPHPLEGHHPGQDRYPRQAGHHQPDRPAIIQLSGGTRRRRADQRSTGDAIPVIQTEPSALQNIADTANRIVERLDQVLSDKNVRRHHGHPRQPRKSRDGLKLTVGKANGTHRRLSTAT
jgi:phospholipid/cholesterol/gamma-HCH transport system substrate-binding protein